MLIITLKEGKIAEIQIIGEPETLGALDISVDG
jgi:hypothetical protein